MNEIMMLCNAIDLAVGGDYSGTLKITSDIRAATSGPEPDNGPVLTGVGEASPLKQFADNMSAFVGVAPGTPLRIIQDIIVSTATDLKKQRDEALERAATLLRCLENQEAGAAASDQFEALKQFARDMASFIGHVFVESNLDEIKDAIIYAFSEINRKRTEALCRVAEQEETLQDLRDILTHAKDP